VPKGCRRKGEKMKVGGVHYKSEGLIGGDASVTEGLGGVGGR